MRKLKPGATPGPFLESVYLEPSKIYDPAHYAFNLPAMKSFRHLDLHPKVTFFVGENGSGKSTMLEAIAIASGLNAEGGSRNMLFATRESHSDLHRAIRLRLYHGLIPDAWFLRAESLFNLRRRSEIWALMPVTGTGVCTNSRTAKRSCRWSKIDSGKACIFWMNPRQRQLEFLVLIDEIVRQDSQLVIATHSPIIMSYPDAQILSFTEAGIVPVEYEDTEHYRVTKTFLDHSQRMLSHLLGK